MSDQSALLRQWTLLRSLGARRHGATLRELAAEARVSSRTIFRDLSLLRELGFPLIDQASDHGRKHWKLNDQAGLLQLSFTLEEAAALYLGRQFLEPLAGTYFFSGAQRAFQKIRSTLGDAPLRHLEKLAAAFYQKSHGWTDYSRQGDMIDELVLAIEDRRLIVITYQSLRAAEPAAHYGLHPYSLVWHKHALSQQPAFKVFLSGRSEHPVATDGDRYFLVGTAAAEVGLDADADVILCDFASLPTLLQRLGRLDRRGVLSRRHAGGNGEPPTMWVFASREETKPKLENQLFKLAAALNRDDTPCSAELMVGTHWLYATKGKEDKSADEAKEDKSAKDQTKPFIEGATWNVLKPTEGVCTRPEGWLGHEFARIAAGPVVMPPVTDAVLDYFSATTDARSPHLSPHPFLYGLAEDNEGTPLVGIAFRLEVEALRENSREDDDTETVDAGIQVLEIFERFPPLRSELHQVKLSVVREWLDSPEAEQNPFIYREDSQSADDAVAQPC